MRAGGAAVAAGAVAGGAALIHSNEPLKKKGELGGYGPRSFAVRRAPGKPRTVMVRGGSPAERIEKAFEELGGLNHFVKSGDKVLIKPNMAWDRTPEYAANTHPEVVDMVIRMCLDIGTEVVVAENPVNEPGLCAESSGIAAVCKRLAVPLLTPGKNDFVQAKIKGKALESWPVMKALYDSDKVINLPIAKHHSLSRVTCALKNWLGIAGGRRMMLHQNIHETIVDLVEAFTPTLSLVDASRVLVRNGPTGGRMADVETSDISVAGLDAATVDVAVLPLLGAYLTEARHVTEALARGLGTSDMQSVHRVDLG